MKKSIIFKFFKSLLIIGNHSVKIKNLHIYYIPIRCLKNLVKKLFVYEIDIPTKKSNKRGVALNNYLVKHVIIICREIDEFVV